MATTWPWSSAATRDRAAAHEAPQALRALEAAGQGHLVAHARTLQPPVGERFLEEAAAWPWEILQRAWATPPAPPPPVLRPPHALTWRRQASEGRLRERLGRDGAALLAAGRVATLLLAGGDGTRLGLEGPKGNLVLGPEEGRTLYAVHAERVAAAGRLFGKTPRLIVLVGARTEEATRAAFREAGAWGLDPGALCFVRQGSLPMLDGEGRAVLEAPGRLALAPDGHGGAIGALEREGLLDGLLAEGFEVLTTFQVDNPLARPLDPVLLGWMVERRAQAVGKAVQRRDLDERIGVFARDLEGRLRVVEYHEMPEGRLPDLQMGSIAVHAFALRWLAGAARTEGELPLHRARRRLSEAPAGGGSPPQAAWRLERFLFDLFPRAARAEVHEVPRAREFAPIKDQEGEDTPERARALVAAEVSRWHAERGLSPPEPLGLHPLAMAEVAAGQPLPDIS